jgi:hypothetical protein
MSSEFVTVATYHYQMQAEPARLALHAAGIMAFVHDANINLLGPFSGNMMGWIKLQVPSNRAAEARALLEASPGLLWEAHPAGETISDDACLSCGQIIPARKNRCPACGWSFLDQPVPEAEAVNDEDADEN